MSKREINIKEVVKDLNDSQEEADEIYEELAEVLPKIIGKVCANRGGISPIGIMHAIVKIIPPTVALLDKSFETMAADVLHESSSYAEVIAILIEKGESVEESSEE